MMGAIREKATGRSRILTWDCVVGRAGPPMCALALEDADVSGMHATIRWAGGAWELKDLGSRNGTYVDGQRLETGATRALREGSRIAFGRVEREWELVDAGSPRVMVLPLEGGEPLFLEEELIGLPSADDPQATVYRGADGSWTLERADQAPTLLTDGGTFEVDGRLYRLSCPKVFVETVTGSSREGTPAPGMSSTRLTFSVSRDEEFVHILASVGGRDIDVGSRVYNFLLLTLARRRLQDAEQGFPDTSCGWIDQEDLSHDPTMAPPQLNLAVYRVRQQFIRLGVDNAAMVVERRSSPRQIRIGTRHLAIVPL
jgi:hypothetical protein